MVKKRGGKHSSPWLVVGGLLLFAVGLYGVFALLLQGQDIAVLNPQGVISAQQKQLILFTLMLSAIVVIPTFIMIGVFAWRYRESNHKAKYTPDVGGNRWIETLWWGIPIVIIGILAVVCWVTSYQLDPYKSLDSAEKPIRVQVLALEWKWLFLYPDFDIASVNELVVPAKTPIDFEITADGPMAAFWVPSLGTQTYAMTGMTARLSLMADNAGKYYGSNSNITGRGYSDMNFYVKSLKTKGDFYIWADEIKANEAHEHLDAGVYDTLREQSIPDRPSYYHLHEGKLFDKVVQKYMHGDSMNTGEMSHEF